jgi:hypothetical protein
MNNRLERVLLDHPITRTLVNLFRAGTHLTADAFRVAIRHTCRSMTTEKPHWQIDTERLAREINSAAASARTEEDLKLRVAPLLDRVLRESGIDVNAVQYEKSTALSAKRMDAVYGYLIIEYKAPGKSLLRGIALRS